MNEYCLQLRNCYVQAVDMVFCTIVTTGMMDAFFITGMRGFHKREDAERGTLRRSC